MIKQEIGICPKCGSNDIEYRDVDIGEELKASEYGIDSDIGSFNAVRCNNCNCKYLECYSLEFSKNIIVK